ncbi:MAG TPA: mechanosensitive ion channel family protein, partial [Anaerovoracaceae bacterium]|nr:mechanosensitive ion channel family protein [Anaerovoracaceae bacterium]
GIIILVNKPFKKGDTVEVSGTVGKVHSIDLLTTQLRTFDNKVVIIPNGTITTSILTNYSTEGVRRVDCQFSIAYESDISRAKEILATIAETMANVLNVPEPIIGIADYIDSAVVLDMKVWCETVKYYDVEYEVKENVKLAFDEAGITIPYPQMDVHVKK